ncbi:MAG: DUF1028 domain-containing protein [Alphaproteobacteria bacterium]|nr:DUF1028 domain-containing protein [Alphaproteobacteria bacterium]
MTWSIVAREKESGLLGVAVTTKAFATGARCSHAASGIGAIATQSFTNPMLGTRGLKLLEEGAPAPDVLSILIAADEGRAIRQLHLVDAKGRNAAYTGASCIAWCGHKLGDGFSVAGNMLAGPAVVEETFTSYATSGGKSFAERLIAALDAGQAAGGDKRGRQSAVLLVYSSEDVADIDLRVDDHPEPLTELRRLLGVYLRDIAPFRSVLPTRARPSGLVDTGEIEREWAKLGREIKFER